ncbi:MAG: DUF3784 domain-containing protein, partial [Defluviitaleaceae bacterium]|nr:DUF3784 domain-containing protein [Defluviitaleaceae bacterium]
MPVFILPAAIGGMLIIISLILLTGRGASLISGYNTMPKEKKAKYNAPALCKFTGKIVMPIGIMIILTGVDVLAESLWFWV